MIPKKIHYCWFGKGEMPELTKKCINSWKKYLPDYELILWSEDNFDINSNQYVKEAYEAKKYAFVSDYVRLYSLYNYGGIYMDTDVEVLKTLDKYLEHSAFTGCESDMMCVTGTMGAEKGHKWIGDLLDEYNDKKFILDDGSYNLATNTQMITKTTKDKYGWESKNKYQVLKGDLHIYPFEVFCAKDCTNGKIKSSNNTYTIHHFSGSWLTKTDKLKQKIIRIIGPKGVKVIVYLKEKVLR